MDQSISQAGNTLAMRYRDVDAGVLAREDAAERNLGLTTGGADWAAYLRRTLTLPAGGSAHEMALALLAATSDHDGARARAQAMRHRAVREGDVRRVRFWAEVMADLTWADCD
jgi:hypothetical protein